MTTARVEGRRARVLSVVGTRPEGIKLAPVISQLALRDDAVESRVVVTGQHSELLDQVFRLFGVARDYDLQIMREGQDLYHVTSACLEGLKPIMQEFDPDMVLVQGDTASAFVGSLAAFYHRCRVGHVEAGLRSGKKWSPYPEEMFRRLADVLTDCHFAPTARAAGYLRREGVAASSIHLTGNTVIDALLAVAASDVPAEHPLLRGLLASRRRVALVTVHRRESFGGTLRGIFSAVRAIADRCHDVEIVFPVHPNPNVRAPAHEMLGGHARIHLVEPLNYLDLVRVLQRSSLVLTDSGGIQEEAPTFGVPVLVLREVTERPEGVEAGVVQLVGTSPSTIVEVACERLGDESAGRQDARHSNPYGDGRAAERVVDIVVNTLCGSPRRTTDWSGPGKAAPQEPAGRASRSAGAARLRAASQECTAGDP